MNQDGPRERLRQVHKAHGSCFFGVNLLDTGCSSFSDGDVARCYGPCMWSIPFSSSLSTLSQGVSDEGLIFETSEDLFVGSCMCLADVRSRFRLSSRFSIAWLPAWSLKITLKNMTQTVFACIQQYCLMHFLQSFAECSQDVEVLPTFDAPGGFQTWGEFRG